MTFRVGLIGKGNVGSCFLELLKAKESFMKDTLNEKVKITGIFKSDGALLDDQGLNISRVIAHKHEINTMEQWHANISAKKCLSKENFDIIVETTPTNPKTGEPGISHILGALNNKIDVIASNKGPFFLYYKQIKELAKKKRLFLKFDATVACCLPIISIKKLLPGNEIISIQAILNGTSNYILSKMTNDGLEFDIALQEAQSLGYAESNPFLDIYGLDSAGKIVILANELLGWSKSINDVQTKGISDISLQKIKSVSSNGQVIKLISKAKDDKLIVEPCLIKKDSLLNLNGNFNGIILETRYAGPIVLIGRGAGGYEAASAILNNLIEIIQNRVQAV